MWNLFRGSVERSGVAGDTDGGHPPGLSDNVALLIYSNINAKGWKERGLRGGITAVSGSIQTVQCLLLSANLALSLVFI